MSLEKLLAVMRLVLKRIADDRFSGVLALTFHEGRLTKAHETKKLSLQ